VIVRTACEGGFSLAGWVGGVSGSFSSDLGMAFSLNGNDSFIEIASFVPVPATDLTPTEIMTCKIGSGLMPSINLSFSDAFGDSVQFLSSPLLDSVGVRAGPSARRTETAGLDSSQRFGRTEGFESNSDSPFFRQAAESAVIWIGAGSAFAVIVVGTVAGFVLVLVFRGRSSVSSNQAPESEVEINAPTESQSSVPVDPFLSGENALSVDGRPKGLNDGGEHLMAHAKDE
jgi:hypothetical protein